MTISAQVIDTIVEWIDDNLHQPLRIDDIARRRVFKVASATAVFALQGESLGRYIRERKLSLAARIYSIPMIRSIFA
jgi:AraC family multidrug resistance transcriptional activator